MGKEFNRALITVGERNSHVLNHRKSSFIFKVILVDSILKTYSSIVCKIRIFCQESETGKLDDLCVFVLLGTRVISLHYFFITSLMVILLKIHTRNFFITIFVTRKLLEASAENIDSFFWT